MNEFDEQNDAPVTPPIATLAQDEMTSTVAVVIEVDAACRKCGYNLRGMRSDGRCPECGIAVSVSLRGDLLRFSDPIWLDYLRRGINLILGGIVVIVLVTFGAMSTFYARGPLRIFVAVAPILHLFSGLLMLGGAWLLTTPDPSGIGEDKYGTSRKAIRVALLVGLGNHVLTLASVAIRPGPDIAILFQIAAAVAAIIGLVGQAAQLKYISKIAMRIPDDKLSERARFLMWAIGIDYGIVLIMSLIIAFTMRGNRRGGATSGTAVGMGCFGGLAALGLVIFGFMYLRMLTKLKKLLKEQSVLAHQSWDAHAT